MAKKRRSLRGAVSRFADDLRIVTQQLNDGVNFLTRAAQHKPCIAPQEFRETLSSLQDDVTEITKEVETLESFTVDAISFEELLGHCLALYQANRNTIQLLEAHLQQYGYHPPPGVVHEPENPITAAALAAANAPRRAGCEAGALGGGDDDDAIDADMDVGMDRLADLSFRGLLPMDFQGAAADATQDAGEGPATSSRAGGRYGAVKEGPVGRELAAIRGYGAAFKAEDGRPDNSRKAISDKAPSEDAGDRGAAGPGHHRAGADSGMGVFDCDRHGTLSRLQQQQQQHQSHGLNGALSARATGRKAAPRPSVDSRASSTPDSMLLSPSVHELLAKYNPPSESDHGSLPPSASRGPAASAGPPGPVGSTPDTAEVVAVIQKGLVSHSVRPGLRAEQNAAPAALPMPPQLGLGLGPGCSAEPGMGHKTASAPVVTAAEEAQQQQQQVQQGFLGRRVPAVEEDTCALYQQLIRSSHVPGSLAPGQPPQPRAQPQPPQPLQPCQQPQQQTVASLRMIQPSAAPPAPQQHQQHSRIPSQQSPRAPPAAATPAGAEPEEPAAPDGITPRATRSKTPLSVLRANRQQHDKQLAEKLAGLEETLAGLTPLRRSCAGGLMRASIGGAAVTAANAAALEHAKSPGPSRAAVEAAALANMLAGLSEATTAGPANAAAAPTVMGAGAAGGGAAHTEQRVLSPLQPKALAGMLDTPPSMRGGGGTRISCLPAPPGAAVAAPAAASAAITVAPAAAPPCSTVIGATTRSCAATAGAAAATPKPMQRGTPGRPKRGTPGRVPRPYTSPPGADEDLGPVGRGMEAVTPRAAGRVAITPRTGGEAGTARATPHRKSIATAFASTATAAADVTAPTPSRASRIAVPPAAAAAAQAAVGLVGAPGGVAGAGGAIRTPGRIRCREAQENTFYPPGFEPKPATEAPAAAVRVPQLRLEACIPTAPRRGDDSDWLGFPLSRRTPGRDGCGGASAHADAMDVDPRDPTAAVSYGAADEPTLAMPPSVSRSGTPTIRTPEHGHRSATPTGGGAFEGAVGAVVVAASSTACATATGGGGALGGVSAGMAMLSLSTLEGLSPGTSQLVSRAMGEGFAEQLRPAGMSRIPAPAPAPNSKPASAAPSATYTNTSSAGQPYGSSASAGGSLSSYRPNAANTAAAPPSATAAAVAAAAAAPLPPDFEPVSEEEWRGLAPRTQQAFPLKALNDHLRTLAKTVASRPAPQEGCFSVADLEAMSLSTMASKLLVNVLVKLGRCRVAAGAAGAGVLYRLEL